MRQLFAALALILGLEATAFACSCAAPRTNQEARAFARAVAPDIVAIIEGEALSEYRRGGSGELVQVRRTLFGKAPRTFRVERGPFASGASCDLLLAKGQRKILILARPEKRGWWRPRYRIQNLCSDLLTPERYLPILIDEARRASR